MASKKNGRGNPRRIRDELREIRDTTLSRMWNLEGEFLKRSAIDDICEPLSQVVRQRVFIIAIHGESREVTEFVHFLGILREQSDRLGIVITSFFDLKEPGSYGAIIFAETSEAVTKDGLLASIRKGFTEEIAETAGAVLAKGTLIVIGGVLGISVVGHGGAKRDEPKEKRAEVLVVHCDKGKEQEFTARAMTAKTAAELKDAMKSSCRALGRFDLPEK